MSDPRTSPQTLTELIELQGFIPTNVSIELGLDPALIERVDKGRQGFPESKVNALATAINVSPGTVRAAARRVVDDADAPVSLTSKPLPPNPLYGDVFPTNRTGITQPDELQRRDPALLVFAVGQDVGNVGAVGGLARIERNGAVLLSPVAFTNVLSPISLAKSPDTVYTVGTQLFSGSPYVAAVSKSGAIQYEVAVDTGGELPFAIEYEPVCACLWISVNTQVIRLNVITGAPEDNITLTHAGNDYTPRGMLAANGKVYVAAYRTVSESDAEGHLFEVDPVTSSITRVSSGQDLHFAYDVAYDGVGTFFVVSGIGTGSSVRGLSGVPDSSFAASFIALSTVDLLTDPRWVIFAFGSVFVAEANDLNTPKLWKIAVNGTVNTTRTFTGTGPLGKPDVDPLLLWVPNPQDSTVTMLEPANLAVLTTVNVGGTPHAVRVV